MARTARVKWKITFNAPVVLGFGLICLVALVLGIVTEGVSTVLLFSTYHSSLTSIMTWIRLFTHVFGHADWSHFIGNMSYILLLGPMLEEKHGSKMIMQIIAVTAFATGIIHFFLFPHVVLLGASGVVFAFILLSSITSFRSGEIPITFILVAFIFLGQQVFDGLFLTDNIANLAHIIGGVIGAVFGFVAGKRN